MNVIQFGVAAAMFGVSVPFLVKARQAKDAKQARTSRLAGILFMMAGAAFIVSGVLMTVRGS